MCFVHLPSGILKLHYVSSTKKRQNHPNKQQTPQFFCLTAAAGTFTT